MPTGSVRGVALNHRSLATPSSATFARALHAFVERLEPTAVELTLAACEAIVFDNRRILHSRTGFDASSGRHLQGCYIDIDALHSPRRQPLGRRIAGFRSHEGVDRRPHQVDEVVGVETVTDRL